MNENILEFKVFAIKFALKIIKFDSNALISFDGEFATTAKN